jgi:hypothetical protein
MQCNQLDAFVAAVRAAWGNEQGDLVETCRSELSRLSLADPHEGWLAGLLGERPATRELHRDANHGFMLLAHAENEGLYRPPHNHGWAWVVYCVQSGELEVATYATQVDPSGDTGLVELGRTILRPGEARAYLPGEIHDTRCLSETAVLFRFTERDLRHEDQVEGRVTRFAMRDGRWSAPRS